MPPVCESKCTQEKVLIRINPAKPWSTADIQTLMELLENRETMEVITRKLDRSESSIRYRMVKLGLRLWNHKPGARHVPCCSANEPWTDTDVAILRKEWNAGKPTKTIAKILGRTRVAVSKKRQSLQLNMRYLKSVDALAIQHKYETGVTIKKLALEFDISEYAVISILKKRGYINSKLVSAEKQKIIEERYKDGCTTNCIARRVGKTSVTVQKYINNAGLSNYFWPQEQEIIRERHKDGCTTKCIAHRVRKGRNTVYNYIKAEDPDIIFQSLDDLVIQLLESNLTVDQICAKLELPRVTILAALKRQRRADNV